MSGMFKVDTFALKAFSLISLVIVGVGVCFWALVSYSENQVIRGSVREAYARVSKQGEARVYFRLDSGSRTRPFQFSQAESPDAKSAEIYLTRPDGRVAPVAAPVKSPGGFTQNVPVMLMPDRQAAFQPGGYFVMLRGLKKSVYSGDQIRVKLTGPDDSKIELSARALGAG